MLDKGGVPHKTEDEGADKDGEREDEELPHDIRLVFRLGKVGEHFINN